MEEANRPDIPDAYVTHSSDGRLRLKVPEKKGDKAYFARIRHAISTVKGVGKVTVNPGTGSILVLHDVKPNDISKFAFTHKLFEIRELSLIQATARERIKSILNRADVRIRSATEGQVDLGSLAFLGLVGAGLLQVIRGRVTAPPWHTLIWYGTHALLHYESGEEEPPDQ